MADMEDTLKSSLDIASKLGDLLATLPINDGPEQWNEVELTAQSLANALRIKDPQGLVDQHTALGKTLLPQTLSTLLKNSFNGARTPSLDKTGATYEILRAGANLCMDHDENRAALLDAGFPQTIVSLLEGYAEAIPTNRHFSDPLSISLPDLKVVKTSIGVILNASLGYEPVRTRLLSLEVAMTILRLSMAIYPPGSWLTSQSASSETNSELEEWGLRAGLSAWAWRALSGLRTDKTDAPPIFGPDVLPLIIPSLHTFLPPFATPHGLFTTPSDTRETLISADMESLEESCALLEILCLDVEDVRLALARSLMFTEEHGVECLSEMLTFVRGADYPPWWNEDPDKQQYERSLDNCKAGVIKGIVEVAGEEKNTDVLWDESEDDKPGGEFVSSMVEWIKTSNVAEREDLIICATLSIANLIRREAHSQAIVKPPISLAKHLAPLLDKDVDHKVKHGVIGLLKNLAQSVGNRGSLGEAGIIPKLADSQVWAEKSDFVEIVQVSAIGTTKHLCNGNVDNALSLVLGSEDQTSATTALEQIMALVRRSDSVTVKSEGTRVLSNAIKSLTSDTAPVDERRKKARATLATSEHASALAALVGRSKKYPMLINEGVVALSFLTANVTGALLVVDAITAPLSNEVQQAPHPLISEPETQSSTEESPVAAGPTQALDVLVGVLKHPNPRCPIEVRANICTLLGQLGRKGGVETEREVEVRKLKEATKETLEAFAEGNDLLAGAATRTLEAWG